MTNPVNDRGSDAFLDLLHEGTKGEGPKAEALEALSLRPVWLATWEPKAEGYRTLINASGEEALAVFSSEKELKAAAVRFDWLDDGGSIATHQAIGGDILRHAWTREYAFVVIDIGSDHSLEYEREELKAILREVDTTGPFRTSRPPAPAETPAASSSFPPPKEPERISTLYTMVPSETEKIDRLSDRPTSRHRAVEPSEPPTKKRAAVKETAKKRPPTPPPIAAAARRRTSRPVRKPKSEPPAPNIEEVQATSASLGDGGTYGAASVIPTPEDGSSSVIPEPLPFDDDEATSAGASEPAADSTRRSSSPARELNSDLPTAPGTSPLDSKRLRSDAPTAPGARSLDQGKLRLPKISGVGAGLVEPPPPPPSEKPPPKGEAPRGTRSPKIAAPGIGAGINLAPLLYPPDDVLLKGLADVLRNYFEVEWASYCLVARPKGDPTPAVALRIEDNFRDNVTAIIKDLTDAGRRQHVEIDVLLIDGHDMLRKARERAYVFYPWTPKPFGG